MTIRIDSARNRIAATIDLLTKAGVELEDLHVLAYDRRVAAEERVGHDGGARARDYCLDTHGDSNAREAYRSLTDAVDDSCAALAAAGHDVLRILRADGSRRGRIGPRTATALEIAELIANQADRIRRGEYTPIRGLPQPSRDHALRQSEKARHEAEQRAGELQRKLDKARQEISNLRDRSPR